MWKNYFDINISKSLLVVMCLVLFTAGANVYAACSSPSKIIKTGKYESGENYMGDPTKVVTLYFVEEEGETVTTCTHSICYNGWWDSMFGTGHKCNEVCSSTQLCDTSYYQMKVKYYTFGPGHIELASKLKAKEKDGWLYVTVKEGGKSYRFWVKQRSKNTELDFVRQTLDSRGAVASESSMILYR